MELKCWNRIVYTIDFKCTENGVPAVVQWVKNLTAEAQVGSPAWCSGLKDLALLQLQQVSASAQIQSLAWELPYAKGGGHGKKDTHTQKKARDGVNS